MKFNKVEVLGVPFVAVDINEAVRLLIQNIKTNPKFTISLANPEFLVESSKNKFLFSYLSRTKYNFADGIGVIYASKLLHEDGLRYRVTGTDILPKLIQELDRCNLTIYFLGGGPGVASKAKDLIEKKLSVKNIVGVHHGYFNDNENEKVINEINNLRPNVLMVCLGNPRQEKWIDDNFHRINAELIFGNGGALDFWSSGVKRAPKFVQQIGFEWLFRLSQDFSIQRLSRQSRLLKYIWLVMKYGNNSPTKYG